MHPTRALAISPVVHCRPSANPVESSRFNRLTDVEENSHKLKVHSVGCKVGENCRGGHDDDVHGFGLFVFYGFPVCL